MLASTWYRYRAKKSVDSFQAAATAAAVRSRTIARAGRSIKNLGCKSIRSDLGSTPDPPSVGARRSSSSASERTSSMNRGAPGLDVDQPDVVRGFRSRSSLTQAARKITKLNLTARNEKLKVPLSRTRQKRSSRQMKCRLTAVVLRRSRSWLLAGSVHVSFKRYMKRRASWSI